MNHNDLTFFTNEPGKNLKSRFNSILKSNTQFFDVLVGYFRTSGFHEIHESLESVEKIRILIGINTGKSTIDYIQTANEQQMKFNLSTVEIKKNYVNNIVEEMEQSEDTKHVKAGIKKFIELILSQKLEIRIYPKDRIHSKVYIMRKDLEKVPDQYGTVITGSSNFTSAGLVNNLEFNVELKDSRDVYYALQRFEELWVEGISISEDYIATVQKDTWIREDITPYELYLKFIYEYFKEELNLDKKALEGVFLPENYMKLKYQEDAVNRARKILDEYGGVFISDVVGLGKTYICAMLAQTLKSGKKLVICPPVLIEYWKGVFLEFDVSVRVESLGKLDSLIEDGLEGYKYVFIDEAHRFRNQGTESYQKLHQICYGKKVILVSATPQNNSVNDIANQIFLFQNKRNSDIIPNLKDLESFFFSLQKRLDSVDKGSEEYLEVIEENSKEVRDKILQNIMVRRTRKEIEKYYKNDLLKQGLSFPVLETPQRIIYTFDENMEKVFNETIKVFKKLKYSRYKPLVYLTSSNEAEFSTMLVGQRNLSGFMKAILIKRLESSFFAFRNTLNRFIASYTSFIDMFNNGSIYISKKINVYDLLDSGNEEKLLELIESEDIQEYSSDEFNIEFIKDLKHDYKLLNDLRELWETVKEDPKLDGFIKTLKTDETLKRNKIIIFSESAETVNYLYEKLNEERPGEILLFSGHVNNNVRTEIEKNFNPNYQGLSGNKYSILITTDVLAEGINLHRSNIVINYDLPWNPTKVMQRVGRVNRVGTAHQKIYVYNIFPTTQSNEHLSLEQNIINKIQAFHNVLGEDFKYLSEQEVIKSHNLFGKHFYNKINDISELDEGNITSDLEFLTELREIRDNSPEIFEKVKNLPKKSTSGMYQKNIEEGVLTFFRKGSLKKFILSSKNNDVKELTLFEAIDIVRANEQTPRVKMSNNFYEYLESNKNEFNKLMNLNNQIRLTQIKRNSNEKKVLNLLKAIEKMRMKEVNEKLVKQLIELWENGALPFSLAKEILKETKGMTNPIRAFEVILKVIPEQYYKEEKKYIEAKADKTEIILSSYVLKENEQ